MNNRFLTSIYFLIIAVAISRQAFAQEEFIDPPARLITKFSFKQLYGGIILVRGAFSSYPDSLNFILDTGSGGISLDSATAEYLKIKPEPSDKIIRGIAGTRQVKFIYNKELHFPGLTVDSLNFHINDYEIISSVYGERIDGIIGYPVLSQYIVKIDYDSLLISFYSKGYIKYPKGGHLLRPIIHRLPVQTAKIRDDRTISSRFLFDMGAGLCLMLTSDFIKDSSLMKRKKKYFVKEAEGIGGKIDILFTVVKEFRLGPYRFRNVPVYVFDDVNNVTSYPFLMGILGNDLLRRFNIILNYGRRDFYITPNSHFNDLFDYSYSGIELYSLEGVIVIGDVAKNSPAEKAGLKEGDIVVGINKAFDQNITHYKAALQASGGKVKIVVRRGSELLTIDVRVISIL